MQQQLVERVDKLVRIAGERIPRRKIDRCTRGSVRGNGWDRRKDYPVDAVVTPQ